MPYIIICLSFPIIMLLISVRMLTPSHLFNTQSKAYKVNSFV